MPRSVNPTPFYPYAPGGFMYFYNSGTNDPLNTYADSALTIPNAHPVPLSETGILPNVFFSGSAKQVLVGSTPDGMPDPGQQFWERDPVGADAITGEFASWDPLVTYNIPNIVVGSDLLFYQSIINMNEGNDPTSNPESWEEIRFIGMYNVNISYFSGEVVQDASGSLWSSQVDSNLNNTPSADNGSNWLPSVDGSKIPEIINLETRTTTLSQLSGGGALTALRLNQLQDGDIYTLPFAASVDVGQILGVSLPSEFSAFEPTISVSGSDTITASTGTDTDFQINIGMSTFWFMSDGVSDWRVFS